MNEANIFRPFWQNNCAIMQDIHVNFEPDPLNSSWSSRCAIRQHRSVSTSPLVMPCCLKAQRHFLNQCWLTINEVLLHSFQVNVYFNTQWNGCFNRLLGSKYDKRRQWLGVRNYRDAMEKCGVKRRGFFLLGKHSFSSLLWRDWWGVKAGCVWMEQPISGCRTLV